MRGKLFRAKMVMDSPKARDFHCWGSSHTQNHNLSSHWYRIRLSRNDQCPVEKPVEFPLCSSVSEKLRPLEDSIPTRDEQRTVLFLSELVQAKIHIMGSQDTDLKAFLNILCEWFLSIWVREGEMRSEIKLLRLLCFIANFTSKNVSNPTIWTT